MLGILSKLHPRLVAVLAVVLITLGTVQPGAAQNGFTISGPTGERIPGGRIVQRGAKFTVTFQSDIPGSSYHVEGLGYYWGGDAYRSWAEDPPSRVEIDTALPISGPIGRFSIYLTRHLQGASSAPWPDLEVIASEDIWVLNDLSPFSGAVEILNSAEIRADGDVEYRVTITPEMRSYGREDDPLDADRFSTYIARLGGTLETGIAVGETTNSINRRGTTVLVPGVQDLRYSAPDPGIYEMRVQIGDGGLIYAAERFEVLPEIYAYDEPERVLPVPLDLGFERSLRLPNGDSYQLGDPLRIEVDWIRDDPEAPELPDWYPVNNVAEIIYPGATSDTCLIGQSDIPNRYGRAVYLEAETPQLFASTLETEGMPVGQYQIATLGENDGDAADTYEAPIDQFLPFEILPPDGNGLLSVTRSGDKFQGYQYEVGLNGALPDGLTEARVRIVRPAMKTSGGAILPERHWSESYIRDGEALTLFGLSSLVDLEFQLIGYFPCGNAYRDCAAILDSVPVKTEDGTIPQEIKDLLVVDPAQIEVVQPWPRMRSDPMVICGQEPDEKGSYQSPPFLALEAASYPREPVAGLPLTAAFRIENVSQLPAAGVVIDLELADPGNERAPKELLHAGELCTPNGGGAFQCVLGDMASGAVADLVFTAETPMTGAVIWTADVTSAGDLGGATEFGGVLGEVGPPRIVDVVVLNDQQRVEYELPSYPYPIGSNARLGKTRYLLVVGHNLPQQPSERVEVIDTGTINYNFLAFPDSTNQHYQEWFSNGWKRFYDTEDAAAARAQAKEDGYDALLIRADFQAGVMPGRETISVSGAQGHWPLLFGDISARFSFVRLLSEGGFDILENAYTPERIHLAVQPNMPLPVDEIPLWLNPENLGAGGSEITLTARRSALGGGSIYLAGPLDLHRMGQAPALSGGVPISTATLGGDPGLLQARIDEDFTYETFRLPIDPVVASVAVGLTPAQGDQNWLWRDALNRAARCHDDVEVQDWALLTQSQSEEIWNLMIMTTSDHFPGQSVTFGHHAATILMRDMFMNVMQRQLRRLEWISNNTRALRGLVDYMKPRAHEDGQPLLRMVVKDFDGSNTQYRYAILNDTKWLAEQNGTSEAAIEAWQERATVEAIGKLIEAARGALEQANDAGDCEVEDLVRMTGFSFEPIAARVKAELVTLAEAGNATTGRSLVWQPDYGARYWIDQVAPLAAAVREQQRRANIDTDITLAAVTFVALPFMLAENTAVVLIAFAIDLVDLGVTTYSELSQYFASQEEVEFASGAAVTLGDARYEAAQVNAKGWASTSFGIGTSALGVITGGLDALPRIAALRRVARGRHVARNLESAAGLDALRPVDLQDFGAFAMSARMRAQQSGLETLSSIERRSLGLVDEYSATLDQTRLLPEPDLPPANIVDSAAPSAPVRFDPDAQSGLATVRPPPGGRIDTPHNSGEVPNAFETRAPGNPEVHVIGTDGLEQNLPLGERLGGGYTSEVFAHADDPENLAIRVTYFRENAPAAVLDEFGDRALRTRLRSEHVRPVRIHETFEAPGGMFRGQAVSRVTVVERLPETAQEAIARQGGRMSIAQMMAYEGAMRDMNRQGLVWLDNKWDNFAFVPSPAGGGRVEVVILDPGGIALVRGSAGASAADTARQIQLRINGDYATHHPNFAQINTPRFRNAVRRESILDDFDDVFVYEAMGIPGREQLLFNTRSGDDFDYVAPLFEVAE